MLTITCREEWESYDLDGGSAGIYLMEDLKGGGA